MTYVMASLEIKQFPAGISVSAGTQLFFFPYKIIQHVALKREGTAEAPIWTLMIRTAQDKINLQSSKCLDTEFAALCMHFH